MRDKYRGIQRRTGHHKIGAVKGLITTHEDIEMDIGCRIGRHVGVLVISRLMKTGVDVKR